MADGEDTAVAVEAVEEDTLAVEKHATEFVKRRELRTQVQRSLPLFYRASSGVCRGWVVCICFQGQKRLGKNTSGHGRSVAEAVQVGRSGRQYY